MNKNKKFALISLIIFSVITLVSFLFFHTCRSENCEFSTSSAINIVILTLGIIGLVYCFFELKGFNKAVDQKLIEDYSDVIADLNKDETLINDNQKDKDDKRLISF